MILRYGAFLFIVIVSVIVGGPPTYAFYNDSNVIEIGDVLPLISTTSAPQAGAGAVAPDVPTTPPDTQPPPPEITPDTPEAPSPAEVSPENITIGPVIITKDTTPLNTTDSGTEATSTAKEIYTTLVTNLAINVPDSIARLSFFGDAPVFALDGASIRAAFAARGISSLQFLHTSFFGIGPGTAIAHGATLTQDDTALIISAAILVDHNIQNVSFSEKKFFIDYQVHGRLFFIIPVPLSMRVFIDTGAQDTTTRVKLSFPWYTFLVATGVSKSAVIQVLDAAVVASRDQSQGFSATVDVFTAVHDALQKQYGAQ